MRPERVLRPVGASVLIMAALLVLILPLRWLGAAVLAGLFHELCHLAAVKLLGGRVTDVSLGPQGAVIVAQPMSRGRELVCILAGPLGGLLLLPLVGILPRTAICSALLSAYNLLPVYPLDGGRALRCASALLLRPDHARILCSILEQCCCMGLLCVGIYASFVRHMGMLPMAFALLILFKAKSANIPCKTGQNEIQ